jgi:hypothetical protein
MNASMTMAELAEELELDQAKSHEISAKENQGSEEMPEAASRRRGASKPSERDYEIYQRSAFELKPQSELALEYGLSQQRVSQILRNAERWMATHSDDDEAQRMRVRVHSRWEVLFGTAMRMFDRSRQDQEIVKERTTRRAPDAAAEKAVTTTVNEKTVKQQNGDVRFLQAAMRVTERQQKLWEPQWEAATANPRPAAPAAEHVEQSVPVPVPPSELVKQEPSVGNNGQHRRDVRATPPHSVLADLLESRANGAEERVDLAICGNSSRPSKPAKTPRRFGDVVLYNMADVVGSPGS